MTTYRIFAGITVLNDDDGQPLEFLSIAAVKTVLKWYQDSWYSAKGESYYIVDSHGVRYDSLGNPNVQHDPTGTTAS